MPADTVPGVTKMQELDVTRWKAVIVGPGGSGAQYTLFLRVPKGYPFKGPLCRILGREFHFRMESQGGRTPTGGR